MYKICIEDPFQNCDKIYPIQQRKVKALLEVLKRKDTVQKVIIFGSTVNGGCHVGSDVDLYVELSSETKHLVDEAMMFCFDLWTNYSVDERLLQEILKTGVIVYERNSNR